MLSTMLFSHDNNVVSALATSETATDWARINARAELWGCFGGYFPNIQKFLLSKVKLTINIIKLASFIHQNNGSYMELLCTPVNTLLVEKELPEISYQRYFFGPRL